MLSPQLASDLHAHLPVRKSMTDVRPDFLHFNADFITLNLHQCPITRLTQGNLNVFCHRVLSNIR